MSDATATLEVSPRTRRRLQRAKARLDAAQPDCPDHTMDGFIGYLLDTEQAAREGYFDAPDDSEVGER